MPRDNAFSLLELAGCVALLAVALAMFRVAVMLAALPWGQELSLVAGALALGASVLVGAVAGNGFAVLAMGREHAIEGVIIGGAVLSPPLLAIFLQVAA